MKKLGCILFSIFLLAGCQSPSSSSPSLGEESVPKEPESVEISTPPSTPKVPSNEVTIDFTNSYQAVKIDDHPEYFEAMFEGVDVISSVSYGNAYLDMGALKLGSGKDGGYLVFHFSEEIAKVEVTARVYTKYVEYTQSYNIDYTHLDVNDVSVSYTINEQQESTFQDDLVQVYSNVIRFESKQNEGATAGGYRILVRNIKLFY